jgi:hypothetical protein
MHPLKFVLIAEKILFNEAGFSAQEESKIFSENICRLLGAFEIKTHSKNATDFTDFTDLNP